MRKCGHVIRRILEECADVDEHRTPVVEEARERGAARRQHGLRREDRAREDDLRVRDVRILERGERREQHARRAEPRRREGEAFQTRVIASAVERLLVTGGDHEEDECRREEDVSRDGCERDREWYTREQPRPKYVRQCDSGGRGAAYMGYFQKPLARDCSNSDESRLHVGATIMYLTLALCAASAPSRWYIRSTTNRSGRTSCSTARMAAYRGRNSVGAGATIALTVLSASSQSDRHMDAGGARSTVPGPKARCAEAEALKRSSSPVA
jgi:hypothetical protein